MSSYMRKGARPRILHTSLNLQAPAFVPPPLHQIPTQPLNTSASAFGPAMLAFVPLVPPQHTFQQLQSNTSQSLPVISQGSQHALLQPRTTFSQSFQPSLGQQSSSPMQCQNQMSDLHSLLQQQNDITALLVNMQTSQQVPRREMPVYDGDPLQYNTFIRAFKHCVEEKTTSKGDCLYYLEQFTRGATKGNCP